MTRRPPRGFTLIEVTVGAAVALIVIGIVTATFLSQQRSMQALDLSREASSAARDAMLSMQETIGRAGYGIDPRCAFDFRTYSCPSWSAAAPCRDNVNGPDEIVFVSRDPNYYWAGTPSSLIAGCDPSAPCIGHAWQVTAFTTTTVTVAANAGDRFLKGQIVQMVCSQGRNPTMGRIAGNQTAGAAGNFQLTLDPIVAGNPYRANIPASADPCFNYAGVTLFLVNRYRYHVATINGDPWLMLDRGLDFNQNGTTPEENTPDTDPLRYNLHPANIRGVRIRLTIRSLRQDITQPTPWAGDPAVAAGSTSIENRNDFTAVTLGRYRRFFSSVSVTTPNLNSKNPFIF